MAVNQEWYNMAASVQGNGKKGILLRNLQLEKNATVIWTDSAEFYILQFSYTVMSPF